MDRNNAGPKRIPPIRVSASDDSEEEIDREIIKSLTRAHPTNAEVNVDEMIALQQQESTNANLQPAPMAASTSLAKSPKRPNQDLITDDDMADVVEMIALNEIQQQENTNENLQPAPIASTSLAESPKQSKQDFLTDDDMADIEVSQLTSSFESRNRPGTSAVLKKTNRIASFIYSSSLSME
ncbi:uncharacterized protein LOC119071589 [Bradysia coprophila]|uniref:uncharacterized protein LOC119071589 n=1 Tax=Bradysia coprophila TaxID=38358 RepID=UPI00187D7F85|nr:uncharacterized protein LOC119071589 [Bradysia coprophila]